MKKSKCIPRVFFLLMRITLVQAVLMATFTSVVLAGSLKGQGILERKVTLNVKEAEVKAILRSLEKQAAIKFTYAPGILKNKKRISLMANDARLAEVLSRLFSPPFKFTAIDEEQEIVLSFENASLSKQENQVSLSNNLSIKISGRVTDDAGEPLPGVNVVEKGTTNGPTADANGNYAVNITDQNSILVFSFIGFLTKEVIVGTQSSINVVMMPDVKNLSEIVVVGYGEQSQKTLATAITKVNGFSLSQQRISTVGEALAGLAPGVQVQSSHRRLSG